MNNSISTLLRFFNQYNIKPEHVDIIISRYNEDFSHWYILKDYITIYNKGNDIPENLKNIFRIINLPNVGRESHTYLYHITHNYDNLKHITLFIQCDFSDHITEIYDLYKYFIYVDKPHNTFHKMIINLKNNNTCCENMWGRMKHQQKYINQIKCGDLILSQYTFGEWWLKYISDVLPKQKEYKWGPCGIFSVSKDTLLKKSRDYYTHIMDSIAYTKNPEEGHYCERAWYYIF